MFGDYWHMNPKKYNADSIGFKGVKANVFWERDARKVSDLELQWYTVIVVWECDWKFNREEQELRIKNAFNRI